MLRLEKKGMEGLRVVKIGGRVKGGKRGGLRVEKREG